MSFLETVFGLRGQVVIVTGASRGIGAATADMLAGAGATVVGIARSAAPDRPPRAGVSYTAGDITDEARFQKICDDIFARHGRVDILVNVAGVVLSPKTPEDRLPMFDAQIAANLRAPFACGLAASELMKRTSAAKPKSGGVIVNVTSLAAVLAFAGHPGYAASKGGLRQLTLAQAAEFAPHGIRAHSVAPGSILTQMNRGANAADPAAPDRRFGRMLLKRHGTADEVAAAILFLASPAAAYITGENICVDGGWHIHGLDPAAPA